MTESTKTNIYAFIIMLYTQAVRGGEEEGVVGSAEVVTMGTVLVMPQPDHNRAKLRCTMCLLHTRAGRYIFPKRVSADYLP